MKAIAVVIHSCKPLEPTLETKLARECAYPTQEKLNQKIFPPLQKIKNTQRTGDTNEFDKDTKTIDRTTFQDTDDRRASANKGLPKAGVTSYYDSLVLNRTVVFQINSSAETPRLPLDFITLNS